MAKPIPEIALNAWGRVAGFEPPVVLPPVEPTFKKPKRLPAWVWDQYVAALQDDSYAASNDRSEPYWQNLDLIVQKTDAATWQSIKNHSDAADTIAIERRKKLGYELHLEWIREADLPSIAYLATSILMDFNGYHMHARGTRKKAGIKIEKLANALHSELEAIVGSKTHLPLAFTSHLEQMLSKKAEVREVMMTLTALAQGGGAWAESIPKVPKPNQANALRLAFLRIFTDRFCVTYGTPLRRATLGITSVFFDCDSLTEESVAELAPSVKTKKSKK